MNLEHPKFIHLLYVPTMACNMACKYCYLEDNTIDDKTEHGVLETLEYAIAKCKESDVIPFNISLHGGEVTTLSKDDFHALIAYISNYYTENKTLLTANGFQPGFPHIKTNLYGLDQHIDTIREYSVSISGSLDLPLSMHDTYRVSKGGQPTLAKILDNVKLLSSLPNRKKVSATIFKEHFDKMDEMIADIRFLQKETCLDMNDFNFMIGFAKPDLEDSAYQDFTALTEEEQLVLWNRMHEAFDGTDLDAGVNGAWFNEFGPSYCTNCDNCGEKFFLLERNGNIYSCVRGQKNDAFYYGNIYENTVEEILEKASTQIFRAHNQMPMNEECGKCPYLYLCKTGCPYVKNLYQTNQSYTCRLQKALYQSRGYDKDPNPLEAAYLYASKMHPEAMEQYKPVPDTAVNGGPTLSEIIEKDEKLRYIYDPNVFLLQVDDMEYPLSSQILKESRDIIYITAESKVTLYCKKHLLSEVCDYPNNNAVYMMCLSGELITYGDENRTKQAHLFSHQIYHTVLERYDSDREGYYQIDLSGILKQYARDYCTDSPNNLFFTTNALRDYHYTKQKNNAYYHIQAINLPFQNIEFYYLSL